jgi:hypothetical protein
MDINRRWRWAWLVVPVLAFACDGGEQRPTYDMWAIDLALPDSGPLPDGLDLSLVDTHSHSDAGLLCGQILQCFVDCEKATDPDKCRQDCVDQGTPEAQALYNAWYACMTDAVTGACADKCANPQSYSCQQCLVTTCYTDQQACENQQG